MTQRYRRSTGRQPMKRLREQRYEITSQARRRKSERRTILASAPAGHGLAGFLICGAAPLGFTLVPQLLALCKCKLQFYSAVLEIHPGGDESEPFLLRLADQFPQFVFMNKELSRAQRCMIEDVAVLIRTDVRIQQPEFPIFH